MRGSNGVGKGALKVRAALVVYFDQKQTYLVALALASTRRNSGSRAQPSIFTIENHHSLVQVAPRASWPADVPAKGLEARSPQQDSSTRIPQPGALSKDSLARRNLEIWEFGDLGTWKSINVEIWGPGNPEIWGPTNKT